MIAPLLGALATLASAGVAMAGYPTPKVVAEQPIALTNAADVRWLDDQNVAVSDLLQGVAQVSVSKEKAPVSWVPQWPKSTGAGTPALHLAVSPDAIAGAYMAFGLSWYSRMAKWGSMGQPPGSAP